MRTTTEKYCQVGLDEIGMRVHGALGRHPSRYGSQVYPDIQHGVISNLIGGCCSTCGCTHLIRLRGGPVLTVRVDTIGSRELDADEIAIYDYSFITPHARAAGSPVTTSR